MNPPRGKTPPLNPEQMHARKSPAPKQLAQSKGNQKKEVAAKMGRIVQRYQDK